MKFSEWLVRERRERGWSRSEAARRGRISPSMFDKVENGTAEPGVKFLDGVARAFKLSTQTVYRAAGLIPPESDEDKLIAEIKDILQELPPEEREGAYEYIRMRRRMVEEREAGQERVRRARSST